MSGMKDKVVKMTINADSPEEAERIAKSEKGVKTILKTELSTSIYEVVVVQESYGEHGFGYCKHCGTDLCCRGEFMEEACDECM